jgi:hypothetical protein
MRIYKVNSIEHKVYDAGDSVPSDIRITRDWRDGHVGDWVLSDDECIVQVLRRGEMYRREGKKKKRWYVGTCTGTFPISKRVKMDTSRRVNIYSFGGGKKARDILIERSSLTNGEYRFVMYMAKDKMSPQDAYLKAFSTTNPRYALQQSGQLIKTKRVDTAMKEELKPVLEELGISDKSVLKGINDAAETSEKEDVKLRALFKLADILDLEDKTRTSVQQISGAVFKGFDAELLEDIKRPEEIDG